MTQRGSKGLAPLFLWTERQVEVDGQRHVADILWKESVPFEQEVRWAESPSGRVRKISSPPEFKPHTVQGVESRYSNYVIPAHTHDYVMQTPTEGPTQPPVQWPMSALSLGVKAAEPKC